MEVDDMKLIKTGNILKISLTENLIGYLFISPWIIGFLVFLFGPCIYSFYISFTNWDMLSFPKFIGFNNYLDLMVDELFWQSLMVTVRFVVTSVSISIVLSLLLALMLNSNSKAMYVLRTIFYVPSVISGIAVAILWSWIFSPDFGIINYALSIFGIKGPNWLGDPTYAPWTFVIIMCTTFIGAPMVIFIAGLQNIPQQLYESSDIDGANYIQKFFFITLPGISPIILFNTITMIIGAFRTFVQAYTIAGKDGNPDHSLFFYIMYLYKKAFQQMDMGGASAMSWVFFVIVFVLTAAVLKSSRYWVHYEDERS